MEATLVYFQLEDIVNDSIDDLNGITIGPLNAYALVAQWPGIFSIEPNIDGEDTLCMAKVVGQRCWLAVNKSGSTYTVHSSAFVPAPVVSSGILGPHPTTVYRPGGRGK